MSPRENVYVAHRENISVPNKERGRDIVFVQREIILKRKSVAQRKKVSLRERENVCVGERERQAGCWPAGRKPLSAALRGWPPGALRSQASQDWVRLGDLADHPVSLGRVPKMQKIEKMQKNQENLRFSCFLDFAMQKNKENHRCLILVYRKSQKT